jgi:hypothetical protein
LFCITGAGNAILFEVSQKPLSKKSHMGLFSNQNKHEHEIQPCCGPIVVQFGGDSSFKNQIENELVPHF